MNENTNHFELNLENYKLKENLILDQFLLASPYAVAILDKNKKIVNINNNFSEIFQFSLQEIEGKYINDLIAENNYKKQVDKNLEMIYQGQIIKQEGKRRRKDGKLVDVEIIGYPILNLQDVIGTYISYIDISHKQKDSLTGLYNRNYFITLIERYITDFNDTREKFSIIVVDIENFKDINETFGYNVGDVFLIEIANRITSVFNENYTVSRMDGDEFGILIKSINKNDLLSFSNLIISRLNKPYLISKTKIFLNFNIGICRFPKDGVNSVNLIRFANIAIHQAKTKYNDRIAFYNNEISEKMEQQFFLVNYLFSALTNKELTIHYQPIFDIKDKSIVAAEALLRWHNSILGEVSPNKFIPIAEKTGQIITIGKWIVKNICKQISFWQEKGFELVPISINISVNQLEDMEFSRNILSILNSYNVDPKVIELEITERVSTGDLSKIVKNIKDLKQQGIKISMDDFGTGFSSLGQLDIFELDKLKIDKIFIDDLAYVLKRQNLVKSIIAMAHGLNLTTVAEGIETAEQLSQLTELGCHLGQGYLFSKPLKAADFEKLLYQQDEIKLV